jgi:hypothetical protein
VEVSSVNALDHKTAKPVGTLRDYLALARFDHLTKHIFIVPGIVLAYLFSAVFSRRTSNPRTHRRDLHCLRQLCDQRVFGPRIRQVSSHEITPPSCGAGAPWQLRIV